jgi:hypothetical protein
VAAELVHQFRDPVPSPDGVLYVAQAWAERDRGWHGWLVFIAADGRILRTPRERAHASRDAMRAWVTGLAATHLRDALARAVPPSEEMPAA